MGQFYAIEIYFNIKDKKHINKVTIYDSLKILNFSVEQIAKDFDLPIRKLKIDYKKYREKGHILTDEEVNYIRNDVEIMARALEIMFNNKLDKMTIGSDALSFYKKINKNFEKYFPILKDEEDSLIRESYKGGFTFLNDKYKGKEAKKGLVLDVNSLYPSVMRNEKLPFGEAVYFKGKYIEDKLYPLYVQKFLCSFEIKDNMIPTIQIKKNMLFTPTEYLKSSNGEIVCLTLTNVDLDLFFKHYNVYDITYLDGYKFKSVTGLFTDYIDYWSGKKIEAKKEKNNSMYRISKLMLNSLYGKFGLNPNVRSKEPYLKEDDSVGYHILPIEKRDSVYIPIATFITSYARRKTIETSQTIREYTETKYGEDLYIYSDTDSIHVELEKADELKDYVNIDDYILGYWKEESHFTRGKYIRQKCYIEEFEGKLNTTIAGLPKKLGKYVTFNNFNEGFSTLTIDIKEEDKKLTFKHIKGGVLLVPTDFTLK